MEDFQAEVDIQVRFADTDALGHVNNAVYLSWMELGRMAFTDATLPDIDWKKTGFILAHVSIDYLEPVFLGDKVKVYMRAGKNCCGVESRASCAQPVITDEIRRHLVPLKQSSYHSYTEYVSDPERANFITKATKLRTL